MISQQWGDNVRKLADLKVPYRCNRSDMVYKIMLCSDKDGTFVFLYTAPDAVRCSFDEWYPDEESAIEAWQESVDENGSQDIGDPMPHCQQDALLPIRVKGRDKGKPEWGCLEIYENGAWRDCVPK